MTSSFEERTLELHIVSAADLKKVKTLGAQQCYVVAYVNRKQQKQTQADRLGGLNPIWNSKLKLECEEQLLHWPNSFLTVEIKCHGTLRNKLVGSVTIPLGELLLQAAQESSKKSYSPDEEQIIMAYDVHRPSGGVQGTLNMAMKLGEKRTVQRYRSQQTPLSYPQGMGGPSYRPQYAPPHMQQTPYYQQQAQYYGAGYPQMQPPMGGFGGYPQQRPRRGGGMGFGTGLMGGLLGGMLVGDMLDDDYGDYGGGGYGDSDMGDMGGGDM